MTGALRINSEEDVHKLLIKVEQQTRDIVSNAQGRVIDALVDEIVKQEFEIANLKADIEMLEKEVKASSVSEEEASNPEPVKEEGD